MGAEDQNIFEDIRSQLFHFEIPYEEGRWETFQQQYGKDLDKLYKKETSKLVPLWRYAATVAAAVFLIVVFIVTPRQKLKDEELAKKEETPSIDRIKQDRKDIDKPEVSGKFDKHVQKSPIPTPEKYFLPEKQLSAEDIGIRVKIKEASPKNTIDTVYPNDHKLKINQHIYDDNQMAVSLLLEPPANKPDHSGKWKFGIELNPSIVSDRINLGIGISTQYEISKKIKLATGLSYSSIRAAYNIDPVQISSDTSMIGAQSVISAIDIPFSIIYEKKHGWYAAVGVSALAVIRENKVYEFQSKGLLETFTTDPESGAPVTVLKVVESNYTKKTTDTDFKGRYNLSYLNFAVGKQYNLYNKKKIMIEPFVKIPMGGLNSDKVNLLNSGIKFRILF